MIALVHQHATQISEGVSLILFGVLFMLWTRSIYVRSLELPSAHDRRRAATAVVILSFVSTMFICAGWYLEACKRTLF